MISVAEIADKLNAQAPTLAPELLPNGRRAGNKWICSGVHDAGRGSSMWVNLSGAHQGQWRDAGNCPADQERGDMIDLLRHVRHGGDKGAAVAEAKALLGIHDPFTPEKRRPDPESQARAAEDRRARAALRQAQDERDREAKIRGAKALFLADKAKPIAGTPAEAYLLGRGIGAGGEGRWPGSLRFHPEVWNRDLGAKCPALLAMIVSPLGEQLGTHRIWLQPLRQAQGGRSGGWTKLQVEHAKKVLGTFWGGFIPLAKGASGKSMRHMAPDEPVYMTEGPEDAALVRERLPGARVICAISLGNMGAIVFPAAARRLVVVADRDGKAREVDSLERAIAAQQARGMEVSLVMPPEGFKDVNDWHLGLRGHAA